MHSSELEDIIQKRLALWESGRRNSNIAFLLANNYQTYALEFQNQGGNPNTKLYYYLEAIAWSEKALSYEWANSKTIFNYIKARYKDIADLQDIPESTREAAQAIYDAMGEYSDYVK